MKNLEISARTVDEAIQQALEQLNLTLDEVKVTVLKEGRGGVLGLGAEDAKIRVEPLAPLPGQGIDIVETAKQVLEQLLDLMEVDGSVVPQSAPSEEAQKEATSPINFDISGEDLGILIGRRGHTLACLQYIARLIVGHQTEAWVPIVIDVEGYKQRRYGALQNLAHRMAEQVKERQTPFTLEPMPAYERRIIHLTLADNPDVTTESIGQGESRKVVILPRKR
jgi:spoIIIJ-associated protein